MFKSKMVLVSVLLALGTSAQAGSNKDGVSCNGNGSCATTNTTTNQGGNVNNKNSNQQAQGQMQSTKNSNNASQNTEVVVAGDEDSRNPVSTAYAPSMSPSAQCMGVATGGIQGMSIGISVGKSYESKPCNQRELARMFAQIGDTDAARKVLCSMEGSEVVKECQEKKVEKAAQITTEPPTTAVGTNGYYSVVSNPLSK